MAGSARTRYYLSEKLRAESEELREGSALTRFCNSSVILQDKMTAPFTKGSLDYQLPTTNY